MLLKHERIGKSLCTPVALGFIFDERLVEPCALASTCGPTLGSWRPSPAAEAAFRPVGGDRAYSMQATLASLRGRTPGLLVESMWKNVGNMNGGVDGLRSSDKTRSRNFAGCCRCSAIRSTISRNHLLVADRRADREVISKQLEPVTSTSRTIAISVYRGRDADTSRRIQEDRDLKTLAKFRWTA